MNLVLIGTGRMGRMVGELASARGWSVVDRFSSARRFTMQNLSPAARSADVAIDFSSGESALAHVQLACEIGLPLVTGTTGWDDDIDAAHEACSSAAGSVLFAPNFSIGIGMLASALASVLGPLDDLDDFDIAIHEVHHAGKKDGPSGTALHLAGIVRDRLGRKKRIATTLEGPVESDALLVTASRVGSIHGQHVVTIDGPFDTLTISHHAKSRAGFAHGALEAAQWLRGRKGFFGMEDFLRDRTRQPQQTQ